MKNSPIASPLSKAALPPSIPPIAGCINEKYAQPIANPTMKDAITLNAGFICLRFNNDFTESTAFEAVSRSHNRLEYLLIILQGPQKSDSSQLRQIVKPGLKSGFCRRYDASRFLGPCPTIHHMSLNQDF